jgi:hypothetical protein
MAGPRPSDPCPCGSGKRYGRCCIPRATHGRDGDGERVCLSEPCPECNPWGTDPDAWKGE